MEGPIGYLPLYILRRPQGLKKNIPNLTWYYVHTVRLTEVVPKSGLPFLLIEYVIERVWQVFGHFYVANWDLDNLAYQQKLQKRGSPLFKINKNAYGGVVHSLKSTKMHNSSPLLKINKKCISNSVCFWIFKKEIEEGCDKLELITLVCFAHYQWYTTHE